MTELPPCVFRSTHGWCWHHKRGEFMEKIRESGQDKYMESMNVLCESAKGCPEGLK
jgi:hypothetical protein